MIVIMLALLTSFSPQKKHEGCVNIYKSSVKGTAYTGSIHNSKEDDENNRYRDGNYVTISE